MTDCQTGHKAIKANLLTFAAGTASLYSWEFADPDSPEAEHLLGGRCLQCGSDLVLWSVDQDGKPLEC